MTSRTTLLLPDELKTLLAEQARAAGKTAHAYMIDALAGKAYRVQRTEERLAEGTSAVEEFERSGVVYGMQRARLFHCDRRGQESCAPEARQAAALMS